MSGDHRVSGRSLLRIGLLLVFVAGMAGYIVPAVPAQADTAAGYSLLFDGVNDMIQVRETVYVFRDLPSDLPEPGWRSTKTVTVWAKPAGDSEPCPFPVTCGVIVGDGPIWWGIMGGLYNSQYYIWVWNTDTNPNPNPPYRIRNIQIPVAVDEWVHIALVHQGGVLTAYKNGVFAGSVVSGATRQPDTGALPKLYIGSFAHSLTNKHIFKGEIDEVRLYSTALTQQEIWDTIAVELSPPFPAGLDAYYKMSDGSGLTLTDDTGNFFEGPIGKTNNNGTFLDGIATLPSNGTFAQWVESGAFDDPPQPERQVFIPLVLR